MSEDFAAIGCAWAATLPGLPGYYALWYSRLAQRNCDRYYPK